MTDGATNATLPRGTAPEEPTFEYALNLLKVLRGTRPLGEAIKAGGGEEGRRGKEGGAEEGRKEGEKKKSEEADRRRGVILCFPTRIPTPSECSSISSAR